MKILEILKNGKRIVLNSFVDDKWLCIELMDFVHTDVTSLSKHDFKISFTNITIKANNKNKKSLWIWKKI